METPSIGRIVHFLQNGVHHPALILKVWSPTCVTLRVFPNGSDSIALGALDKDDRAHSVTYAGPCSECGAIPRDWSWHWPERST